MTIYLIDFENVSVGGLKGASDLGQQDLVFLFSSKNAARLTTATLATFNNTTLKFVEVPVKKQSLDMHLVSYLGYLIGTTDAEHFIIISNDHDYDNIMAFWRANGRNVTVERRGSISAEAAVEKKSSSSRRGRNSRSVSDNTSEHPAADTHTADTLEAADRVPAQDERSGKGSTLSEEKLSALRGSISGVYDESVCEDVLRIIASHSDERNPLTSIHNDLRDTYEDPDYLDIYKLIKSVLSEYPASSGRRGSRYNKRGQAASASADTAAATPAKEANTAESAEKPARRQNTGRAKNPKGQPNSDVTRINNEVQKLLSKAKYSTEIISYVAGLAAKKHGEKNGKMAIYRNIISTYGRDQGLEIYDRLKPLFNDPELWK